jgi:hypothetical protein
MDLTSRRQRCEQANEVIRAIASCGRKFFSHDKGLARFEVDERGRVWFCDDWSGKRVYTHVAWLGRGFTHGGTLNALVRGMARYIVHGKPMRPEWFDGEHWGYGEDIAKVREAARALTSEAAMAQSS